MIRIQWDARTLDVVARLEASLPLWPELMHKRLGEDLAKKSIEHMKPMMHVRTNVPNTGALENSLYSEQTSSGDGYEITFHGLFYGLYIDDGNDNVAGMTAPTPVAGRPYFPADYRLGAQYMFPLYTLNPMGTTTPGVPNHYSDETAKWLADSEALDVATLYIDQWLESVVSTI